jgi:hypothetical protein
MARHRRPPTRAERLIDAVLKRPLRELRIAVELKGLRLPVRQSRQIPVAGVVSMVLTNVIMLAIPAGASGVLALAWSALLAHNDLPGGF